MSLVDLFNIMVYIQPFLWIALYPKPIPFHKIAGYFYGITIALPAIILHYQISIGHYYTNVLAIYIIMVGYTTWHYRRLKGIKALCLAFLLVYINSYFWEAPIHFMSLLQYGFTTLQLVQALHLIPVPFMLKTIKNDMEYPARARVYERILISFAATFLITDIRYRWLTGPIIEELVIDLNRVISLVCLYQIFKPAKSIDISTDILIE